MHIKSSILLTFGKLKAVVAASELDDLIRTWRSGLVSNEVELMGKTTEVELKEGGEEIGFLGGEIHGLNAARALPLRPTVARLVGGQGKTAEVKAMEADQEGKGGVLQSSFCRYFRAMAVSRQTVDQNRTGMADNELEWMGSRRAYGTVSRIRINRFWALELRRKHKYIGLAFLDIGARFVLL